jgi:hypothetical protein
MSIPPTANPGVTVPPWQEKNMSYGLKLLIMFGFVLSLILAISSLFVVIGVAGSMVRGTLRSTGSVWSDLLPLLIAAVVLVVCGAGVVLLWPLVRRPTSFHPSYGQVAADVAGQPFEVRFRKPLLARSYAGKGTVRFEPGQLVVDGALAPSAWLQIGVVVLLTLLPLLLFGIGLGIIPALLIAALIGRKKVSLAVSYADIRDVTMNGLQLAFRRDGGTPNQVSLHVSQQDGERLYRELAQRLPAALGGWAG